MVSRLGLVPERLIFIGEVDKCCLILLFEPSSASPAYASRWLPDHNRIRHRRAAAIRCQHLSMITSVAQALIFFVLFIRKLVHLHSSIYKTSRDSCPTETPDQKTKPLRGNRNPYGQATLNCIKYGVLISYTLFTSVFILPLLSRSEIFVRSSDTSCGVKNSPPLLPALEAYIPIKYS